MTFSKCKLENKISIFVFSMENEGENTIHVILQTITKYGNIMVLNVLCYQQNTHLEIVYFVSEQNNLLKKSKTNLI